MFAESRIICRGLVSNPSQFGDHRERSLKIHRSFIVDSMCTSAVSQSVQYSSHIHNNLVAFGTYLCIQDPWKKHLIARLPFRSHSFFGTMMEQNGIAAKAKGKSLDKVLAENNSGYDDVIVWPMPAPAPKIVEEDLLGYGVAEPSTKQTMPRRSSLSSRDGRIRGNRRASIGYSGEMTLTLPNKQTVTKRRSVGFDDDDTVYSIDTYDDSDEDDEILSNKRQLWFREEEYRHIENKIRTIVRDSKTPGERPTWLETRGLESVIGEGAEEKQMAIQSVLEDQNRQRQGGYFDEQAIATEYEFNSMEAQVAAEKRAKQDEEEVKEYLEKTRQVTRRLRMSRRASC